MDVEGMYSAGGGSFNFKPDELKPRTLLQKFHAATHGVFRRDFPSTMRTMIFKEDILVPYINEKYGRSYGPGSYVLYAKPIITRRNYSAERFTCAEARKVETAEGPRYQICTVERTRPGLHTSEERDEIGTAGQPMLNKDDAIRALHFIEREYARTLAVAKDGTHTRGYFGNFVSEAPKPQPQLQPQKPRAVFKL